MSSKSDFARMVVVTSELGVARAGRTTSAAAMSVPTATMAARVRLRGLLMALPSFRSMAGWPVRAAGIDWRGPPGGRGGPIARGHLLGHGVPDGWAELHRRG